MGMAGLAGTPGREQPTINAEVQFLGDTSPVTFTVAGTRLRVRDPATRSSQPRRCGSQAVSGRSNATSGYASRHPADPRLDVPCAAVVRLQHSSRLVDLIYVCPVGMAHSQNARRARAARLDSSCRGGPTVLGCSNVRQPGDLVVGLLRAGEMEAQA